MAITNLGRIAGSRIYTDTKPSSPLDGDLYIDTDDKLYYYNADSKSWIYKCTLKGEQGDPGDPGDQGTSIINVVLVNEGSSSGGTGGTGGGTTYVAGTLRISGQDLILTYSLGTDYGDLILTTDMTTGQSTLTWNDAVSYYCSVNNGNLVVNQ